MAIELVGGALLSSFFQVLFGHLASPDISSFFRKKKLDNQLPTRMRIELISAEALLVDAENKQIRDRGVKKWLEELKEVIYEADELMDRINTEALRCKLEAESEGSYSTKVFKCVPFSLTEKGISKPDPFISSPKKIESNINKILDNLKILVERKDLLGLQGGVQNFGPSSERIAPLLDESSVYGRNAEKELLTKLLLNDDASGQKISVIPIVGMGGIGKTTLAQLLYDDEKVKTHFKLKVWVTVSDEFDVLKIAKTILESVTSEKPDTEDLRKVLVKLKDSLTGNKFLFVLDDVWNNNYDKWFRLNSSFESGEYGSKIIVTTRSNDIAAKIGNVPVYLLQKLADEDCWQLFATHAFNNVDPNSHPDLKVIGENIVKKCRGLPLAVKSLAGLLRSVLDPKEWTKILESDIWELQVQGNSSNEILPALWISYYYLPPDLKRCFAYLSIFPKDYEFYDYDKEKLIWLWMAEGLLQEKIGRRIEDVGEECYNALISRSLFQLSNKFSLTYVMHDLVHDLAMFVSGEFCFRQEEDSLNHLTNRTRHLSYSRKLKSEREIKGLSEARRLHTFLALPFSRRSFMYPPSICLRFEPLLAMQEYLRVLCLSGSSINQLPDSIGNLRQLRYLDLTCSDIEKISNTVCSLHNLQTLLLSHCSQLTRFPNNLGNLTNLRHLRTTGRTFRNMSTQIHKLKELQTLSWSIFGGKCCGSGLKELQELRNLEISGLEKVTDAHHALEANLKDKTSLEKLYLRWDWNGRADDKQRETLDAFEPHENLKELTIYAYMGTRFSEWVGQRSFSKVVSITFDTCRHIQFLPPLGQLLFLKELRVFHLQSLVTIGSEFYDSIPDLATKPFRSLEILEFAGLSELQEWSFITCEEGGVFPRLKKLELMNCPKLDVCLPDYLPSLTELHVVSCNQVMPLVPRGQQMDTALPSLHTIKIQYCPEQKLFPEGKLPSSVKHLDISP